jgi:hypothetical protein
MLGKHHYSGRQSNFGKPGRLRSKIMTPRERWSADNILPLIFGLIEAEKTHNCVQYIIHKYKQGGRMKTVRLLIRCKKDG